MNLIDYQSAIDPFASYPAAYGKQYARLGLFGEAGEIANQVKKILRDDEGILTSERETKLADELGDVFWYATRLAHEHGVLLGVMTPSPATPGETLYDAVDRLGVTIGVINSMLDELTEDVFSDLLADLYSLCTRLGTTPEDVMQANVDKLMGRRERGTLQGSGDGR
jgi:NTP pyrophosphatase (non-canonical NTP hydrolase)